MSPLMLAATVLLELMGPNQQMVEVNPSQIVGIRAPSGVPDHHVAGVHCVIFTADGKHISVTETCKQVNDMLRRMQ